MKIEFPKLPVYDHEQWSKSLSASNIPDHQGLMERFLPYFYMRLEIPDEQRTPDGYNKLLQKFLATEHSTNHDEFPEYFRRLDEEGCTGFVTLKDEYLHIDAKAFCFNQKIDGNLCGYDGIVIANHLDQRSRTYGILKIAKAFAEWLTKEKIYFTLYLRYAGEGDMVEVDWK